MPSLQIMSAEAPYAQSTRHLHQLNQCFPETSPMACGRRLQPTTSTTKVKNTCSSVICLTSTPSYLYCPPNPPFPSSRSYSNPSSSMDHPTTSTHTMALHSHLMNSHNFCSKNKLTIQPLPTLSLIVV